MPDQPLPFRFEKSDDSPGFLLWQLTMQWQRAIKRELDKLDLTHTQFVLLASLGWLLKSGQSVSQTDVANHSKTDRMMVSKVLRTLEEKKLVIRADHATDTRAKSLSLTPEGQSLLQKAIVVVEDTDHQFFEVLGQDLPWFSGGMKHLLKDR